MGLFTSKQKFKFKKIPSTPEQTRSRSYLESLRDNDLTFQPEGVADLTGTEKQIQGYLPSYLTDVSNDYQSGRSYLNDVLSGSYDPRESDYYIGFRNEQETMKADAQNQIRRQAQKAGMARSTPSLGIQSDTGRQYDDQSLRQLGGLYENERNRMGQAAAGLQQIGAAYGSNVSGAQNIAAVERQQQQAKLSAAYNAAIQTMLAPYQYNAQIASALLNEQRYMGVQSGGGMTDLGFALNAGASALGAFAGAGGFKSIGQAGGGFGAAGNMPAGGTVTPQSSNFFNSPLSAYQG
jgi:hypothetical protein